MTRRATLDRASYSADDNAATYHSEDDPRNAGGQRIQYIPLTHIRPSPYQTRLVTDPEADQALREDLDERGLVHVPVLRPDPSSPGSYEVVAGHRRIAALRQLAQEGRGEHVLRDRHLRPEQQRIPAVVEALSDIEAAGRTVAENLLRADLRPWEQARALLRHQQLLRELGEPNSVRGLATALDGARGTIGPYLRVAHALTPEILRAAGLQVAGNSASGIAADEALCRLSLAALLRAVRPEGDHERAQALRRELEKAHVLPRTQGSRRSRATDPRERSAQNVSARPFQINIREALGDLSKSKALHYLRRLLPVVAALAKRAGDVEGSSRLRDALKVLRGVGEAKG